MSFSLKYPAMYFECSEQKVFFTACRSCGWEDTESHAEQADCTVAECPSCGSDHIEDKTEYV